MSQTRQRDSIEGQDPNTDEPKKTKSKKPANTAFRQQRLKAWQPILTPRTVLPLFFAIGIIFAPVGGLLIWTSAQVKEIAIDYTRCATDAPEVDFDLAINDDDSLAGLLGEIPGDKISRSFKNADLGDPPTWGRARGTQTYANGNNNTEATLCIIDFFVADNMTAPVLFYYRLTNFYQNHRRYVKSMDVSQLMGDARTANQIKSGDCDPLEVETVNGDEKPYYPCGLIANSLFNDTFLEMKALNPSSGEDGNQGRTYPMSNKGIAWSSDKDLYKQTKYNPGDVVPPPNWRKEYPDYSTEIPNIQEMEEFQVWMRTAGLPTFSKLARRNDVDVLKTGRYRVPIWSNFPVTEYGGTKSILISTRTVMGGKNPFLGIAYIVVGGICIVLGAVFTAAHLIKPRKLGDHTYLSWNNDQQTSASATGREVRHGQ